MPGNKDVLAHNNELSLPVEQTIEKDHKINEEMYSEMIKTDKKIQTKRLQDFRGNCPMTTVKIKPLTVE